MAQTVRGHSPHRAVAAGRALREETQAELAELMAEASDDPTWSEVKVGALERGERIFSTDILALISSVQSLPFEFYLYGPGGSVPEYGSGGDSTIPRSRKSRIAWPLTHPAGLRLVPSQS